MEPIASSGPVLRPSGVATELTALLRDGRVLVAEVLAPASDGTVLLALGRHAVPAESELRLDPGQRFLVRVAAGAGGIVLERLATPAGEDAALLHALRALVGDGRPLGEGLGELLGALRAASGAPELEGLARALASLQAAPASGDGNALRALLAFMGFGHEAALAALPRGEAGRAALAELREDLKSALLHALLALDGGGGEHAELGESLRRALASVETEQLLNLARERAGEPLLLSFPFPDRDGWATARLAVLPRDEDGAPEHGGPDAPFRLVLGVELSELGPLRADLALAPRSLSVRLLVTRADAEARIGAALGVLRERLQDGPRAIELHVRRGTPAEAALGLAPLDIRYLRENHLMNVEG